MHRPVLPSPPFHYLVLTDHTSWRRGRQSFYFLLYYALPFFNKEVWKVKKLTCTVMALVVGVKLLLAHHMHPQRHCFVKILWYHHPLSPLLFSPVLLLLLLLWVYWNFRSNFLLVEWFDKCPLLHNKYVYHRSWAFGMVACRILVP